MSLSDSDFLHKQVFETMEEVKRFDLDLTLQQHFQKDKLQSNSGKENGTTNIKTGKERTGELGTTKQCPLVKSFLEVFFQESEVFKQYVLNISIDVIHCLYQNPE